MGTWSIKNLDNDDAGDWFNALLAYSRKKSIYPYLNKILTTEAYIESEDSSSVLALLEVLNDYIKGHEVFEETDKFARIPDEEFREIIQLTLQASEKILNHEAGSEIVALWQESKEYEAWLGYQHELMQFLQAYLKGEVEKIKPPKRKRIRVKEGDIFFVEDVNSFGELLTLGERKRFGKVIFVSKRYRDMIIYLPSEQCFSERPESIEGLRFMAKPHYTYDDEIKWGNWPIVANQTVSEAESQLTMRRVGGWLKYKDDVIRLCTPEDDKGYPKQLLSGIGAAYYRLNQL
ncbi:MAG: DUF4259 domain-containing protein [Pelistega sp.]|nr:DUF4259 domain-containing protein [Pelistega sp.]